MRVRMLETRRGTEDGFTIRQYMRGMEYDMGDGLAYAFIAAGMAMKVESIVILRPSKKTRKAKPPAALK
jgi:hypothetical protein